jgi:MFS family permease
VLFTFAWNQAPIVSWTTPYVYFMLIIGALLIGAFLYIESAAQYPILPISSLTTTTYLVLACTAAGWACFAVWVYYTFQFLVVLRTWDPLLASAGFAHIPVIGLLASLLAAYLLRRITPYWVLFISMLAFAIGAALMATAPVNQSYWFNAFFGILFIPLGMNMSSPVATVLVTNSLPREHQGIAGSLVVTTVFSAISIGLGMAGTVVSNVDGDGQDILGGYRGAFYFALGLAGLGIVLALVSAVSDMLWPAEPEEGAALRIGGKKGKRAAVKAKSVA